MGGPRLRCQVYRASCALCHYEGPPTSLQRSWIDQERHADSRAHRMAIVERDTRTTGTNRPTEAS